MLNDKDFTKIFEDTKALMYGHFILSSGMRSDTYFQCAKVLQHPKYLMMFSEILCNHFKLFGIEKVISPAMGGIVLGTEVGRQLGVETIFCERSEGNMEIRRGFSIKDGEKILIIEDVLSTGGSLKEVINLINNHNGNIVGIGVVVDRSSSDIDLHKEFFSITKQVANIFDPEDLPDSLKNIPAIKPGSNTIDV
ncbi:MAG: orotate phosphoribosyltransferase [Candidatus Neomarinimicrobiota bacterium]|nr:orotate phosphoribosyltransferase [Candidatus Neomarinimicrobiota bacterium]